MRKTRRLQLQGASNVRDLGGYPCGETITAWHCCYRSDMLNKLTQEDWKKLQEADIQLILDLRSKTEQTQAPYDCAPDSQDAQAQKQFLDSMKLDYVDMITSVPEAVCAALRHIKATRQAGHAVLFHCTAGKDRTGILAALLLKLCGVCNEDILADYQISATYNAVGVNRMLPADVMAIPAVRALFESTPEMLQPLLSLLDQTGCFSYLKSIGMQQAELEELAALLQEP